MNYSPLFVLLTASLFVLPGCSSPKTSPTPEPVTRTPAGTEVIVRSQSEFPRFGIHTAVATPLEEVRLVCFTGGRVEKIKSDIGKSVKAGTSLAAIDSAKAIIQLRIARLQERIAFKNLQQTKKHLADGNASQVAADQAELTYLIARSGRIDAEKNHTGALAVTPISGIITACTITLNQELPPGAATFTVAQLSTMRITVPLNEAETGEVRPGAVVEISAALLPDTVLHGTVKSIAPDAASPVGAYRADIIISNTNGRLASGTPVRVSLTQRNAGALLLPRKLVCTEGKKTSVMVVTDRSTVARRSVTTGPVSDSMIVITTGILPDDRIITSVNGILSEGEQGIVREDPSFQ